MTRPRLQLALATVVVVGVAAGALATVDRLDDQLAATRLADRVGHVSTLADGYAASFAASTSALRSLAETVGPFDDSPDAEARATERLVLVGAPGTLQAVLVVSPSGTVRAADPGSSELVGRPHRGAHVNAALGGDEAVGAPTATEDGTTLIAAAVPLRDADGRLSGSLVGLLPPPVIAAPDLAGVDAALVWQDGTRIEGDGVPARDTFARSLAQRAAEGTGVRRLRDRSGADLVAAYAPVVDGWSVTLLEPASSFDAGRSGPLWVTGTALLLVLGGAVLVVAIQQRRLRAARDEVEDAKRSLLAVAGHELRTPVTVVGALAQTLERRWDQLPDEQRRDLVLTVGRHARTLRHLVERLMFAAQLAARRSIRITPQDVDLVGVVERAVDAHAPLAPTHRFLIDDDGPVIAHADPDALDQVLFHLLDNAVRFSPGGGTIRVQVDALPSPRITVLDEGVGLPADTERLFDRFGQVEDVDTRVLEEGGVGLGLHIVRTLLELQGGTVSGTNRPTGGARFDVVLPGPA